MLFTKKEISLFVPITFLTIGILFNNLPYGYFTLLRLIVCIFSLYYIWLIKDESKYLLSAVLMIIAILFNPLVPIEFGRNTWLVIDVIVVLFFLSLIIMPLVSAESVKLIIVIPILLIAVVKIIEFATVHTYLIGISFIYFLGYAYFYKNSKQYKGNGKKPIDINKKNKVLRYIYIFIFLLLGLIMLSSYRWDLQNPYYVEVSYDYYWVERPEKDRWLGNLWHRSYFLYNKEYANEVIESLKDSKSGVPSTIMRGVDYESLRVILSLHNRPVYMDEWLYNIDSNMEKNKRTTRVILTAAWDIITLLTLIALGHLIIIYRTNAKNY